MSNGKATIVVLIVGLIKRHNINEWIFYRTKSSGEKVKVELDLSNYATTEDLKNSTGVDESKFAKKVDLADLKSNVDKLDRYR